MTEAVPTPRPEGFRRVTQWRTERDHAQLPVYLDVAARTAQEAADALGVSVGQIAAGHPNGMFTLCPQALMWKSFMIQGAAPHHES